MSDPMPYQSEYKYPSDESTTNKLELFMDNYKLFREKRAIEALISYEWQCAVDVGCGAGRYIPSFAKVAQLGGGQRLLYGIDPDPSRIAVAQQNASGHTNLEVRLVCADHSKLKKMIHKFDLLLCSHVVEHISDSTLNQLISDVSLASKQETRIIFLFQFVTDSFFKSENTKISEFYLHSINSEIAPNSHGYRTTVSSDQFDELVAQPAVGQIPVRAINIGQIKLSATSIYPLLVPTDTLRPFSDFGLRAQGVIAYASHLRDHAGTPLIGDAIAWFEKAP